MSSPPWEVDRDLTLEAAGAAISRAFPTIDVAELTHLGSGWEFDAFLTGDGWVFRFPRRADYAELFEPELKVHGLVQGALQDKARIPVVELRGEPGPYFPYVFAAHRHIPGVASDMLDERRLPAFARSVATALGAIHTVPERDVRSAGVGEFSWESEDERTWVERRIALLAELKRKDPDVRDAVRWVLDLSLPIVPYDGPLRLIHNDVSPEHLIVDPDTGRLAGIIDWTDATLGDPTVDFVTLVTSWGWGFARDVLRHYSAPLDPDFVERLRFMSRFMSIMWLSEAHELRSDIGKHVRWVRNAFAADGSS